MGIVAELTGVVELVSACELAKKGIQAGVSEKMKTFAEKVKTLSMDRTPVATGTLRASHEVVEGEKTGGSITYYVQAGAQLDYALIVHENTHARHPQGQAKFLESAANEMSGQAPKEFGDGFNVGILEVLR